MKANPSTKPGAITSLGNTFSNDFINISPSRQKYASSKFRQGWGGSRSGGLGALLRSCPPAFGLPLDLASQNTQSARSTHGFGLPTCKPVSQAEGLGWRAKAKLRRSPKG